MNMHWHPDPKSESEKSELDTQNKRLQEHIRTLHWYFTFNVYTSQKKQVLFYNWFYRKLFYSYDEVKLLITNKISL